MLNYKKKENKGATKSAAPVASAEEKMLGIVARISVDVANAHATGFQNTTALVDIDEWLDSLSNEEQEKVLKHYKKCSDHYSKGLYFARRNPAHRRRKDFRGLR
jgi:hypothetical protein